MSTTEHQTNRYLTGMKVEVEIPLPNTKVFRDWAIVNEVDEDLISLQLSRDILPEGVSLRVGQILTITSQSDGNTYARRAFIVSKGYEQDLLLRFPREMIYDKLREFYRVDVFLPIKFHILDDQNPANVKEQWEAQRKLRREEEAAKEQSRLEAKRILLQTKELERSQKKMEGLFLDEQIILPQEKPQEEQQDNQYDESWGAVATLAVNISGGGLSVFTNQKFNMDELILLEAYVPSTRCIVDIIAQVVFTSYSNISEDEKTDNITGMKFVFIDEAARSAINTHISSIQLKRIRQFKGFTDVEPITDIDVSLQNKHYAYIDSIDDSVRKDHQDQIHKPKIQQVLLVIFVLSVICFLFFYFYEYSVTHPKSEIQEIFENSIRKYRGN
jgi:hypothetical protein